MYVIKFVNCDIPVFGIVPRTNFLLLNYRLENSAGFKIGAAKKESKLNVDAREPNFISSGMNICIWYV